MESMNLMTAEEIEQAKKIWAEVFLFWKTYYHAKNDQKYWDDLVTDADKICERHKGNEFVGELIHACVNDIERRKCNY